MQRMQRLESIAFVFFITCLAGCGHQAGTRLTGLPNQSPTVALTANKVGAGEQAAFDLRWTAHDPDGVVDHFLVTTELRQLEHPGTGWLRSVESARFLRPSRVGPMAAGRATLREPEFFAVRAVDDRGALSEPAWFAAIDGLIPPTVQILTPSTSPIVQTVVAPSVLVDFDGTDPDGVFTQRPVKYKFRLFGANDFEISIPTILADPDSLRRLYAPAFAGWDSVVAESSYVQYTNLLVGAGYVFAVVAFDESGLYSPVFSRNTNVLSMRVVAADAPLVSLRVDGPTFGQVFTNTTPPLGVLAALDRPLDVHWFGTPPVGGTIAAYRSALDPDTLDGSGTGFTPWSTPVHRVVGPFSGAAAHEAHRMVIEARSDQGFTGRAIILIHPSYLTNEKELLIVDDTRRLPDRASHIPQQEWPTAAELDTFLYARGGFPWQFYPAGTLTPPGLFAGYPFDTIGTRTGQANLTVPYETLRKYRHVVWLTDAVSATNIGAGTSGTNPMSALRYMSAQSFSPLKEYLRAGGRLWMVGGGAGKALMGSFDVAGNNSPVPTYSNALNELIPGRFMFDDAHWISEFRSVSVVGMNEIRRGGDIGSAYNLASSFDVSRLPEVLEYRAADTDPVPPLRSSGSFYIVNSALEWLSQPNNYRGSTKRVALDTLMQASTVFGGPFACMTGVSGSVDGALVFSGFDLWSWRRSQCSQVVDAVLNGFWGLQRNPPATRRTFEAAAGPTPGATSGKLSASRGR